MNAPDAVPVSQPEPLFTLELGDNGGRFAPTSLDAATTWIQKEQNFWAWVRSQSGNHLYLIHQAYDALSAAMGHAQQARNYLGGDQQQQRKNELQSLRSRVETAFAQLRLPHSSTPTAKRIEAFRNEAGDLAASYFGAVFVPPNPGQPFQPQDLNGWRGLVEGLVERYDLARAPQAGRKKAAEQSFDELRTRAEALLGEKTEAFTTLHNNYVRVADGVSATAKEQAEAFDTAQAKRGTDFDSLISKHEAGMEQLRKTFREEIALRAPAEYWDSKRKGHLVMSWVMGIVSAVAIVCAALELNSMIHELMDKTAANTQPEAWRIAGIALVGVFALWGARLVVRMFLSHLHLLTDAAERVVMVKTYLSLLEGDQLTNKDDRQLILTALFRPAADGIVKDEGIPPSALEMLTRQSKG